MTLAPNSGEFSYLHFRAVSAYISYISQISRIDSWLSSPELRAHDTGWTTKQISRRPTFSGRPSELSFCMVLDLLCPADLRRSAYGVQTVWCAPEFRQRTMTLAPNSGEFGHVHFSGC